MAMKKLRLENRLWSRAQSFLLSSIFFPWTKHPETPMRRMPCPPLYLGHLGSQFASRTYGNGQSAWLGTPSRFRCSHNHTQMLNNVSSFLIIYCNSPMSLFLREHSFNILSASAEHDYYSRNLVYQLQMVFHFFLWCISHIDRRNDFCVRLFYCSGYTRKQ